MRLRILILPLSALILILLVYYKTHHISQQESTVSSRHLQFPAPLFELYDEHNRLVRLSAYLGRHPVLLITFDKESCYDPESPLNLLREKDVALLIEKAHFKVMAVSHRLPQENRKLMQELGDFPFPLLSDPTFQVQRAWDVLTVDGKGTDQRVFLIDRKGEVEWNMQEGSPVAITNLSEALKQLESWRSEHLLSSSRELQTEFQKFLLYR